ncbi:hypothetical protein [Ensifer sp. Root558]|uniref:hypothetical protein n=1 Tax=Ensifer sp. Root558 TaxID=1736558 RepID=UPI000A92E15B|nr:hypothetical protein [Ensifer sp. Root558]
MSLGITLSWLVLIVLIPLSGLVFRASGLGWAQFVALALDPRTLNALKISFGTAFIAAVINLVFGVILAWVLVRYRFPGKRVIDAMVDLPFALPTAVAGMLSISSSASSRPLSLPLSISSSASSSPGYWCATGSPASG